MKFGFNKAGRQPDPSLPEEMGKRLLAALNREGRARGLFADRPEPDIRQWLDLAALGAVCDVTGLTGFNRALTALGLKVMSDWRNPGLRALLKPHGLLTRDPRVVERKKYGKAKARRSFQFSKR